MALEVPDHAVDLQARVLARQGDGAFADHALGDVDGHVADERPGLGQCVEQDPGLGRRPGAQLDQLDGAGQAARSPPADCSRIVRSARVG